MSLPRSLNLVVSQENGDRAAWTDASELSVGAFAVLSTGEQTSELSGANVAVGLAVRARRG